MTGSIRKRGSTWTAYCTTQGKRQQVSKGGFRTKREAQAHLTAMLHALQTGSYVAPAHQTLGACFDQWISGAESWLRPGTIHNYRGLFGRYVRGPLGGVRLQSLTALQLDTLYSELLRRGLSVTTVVHVHAVLRKSLSDAVRKGLVTRNVAEAATPPRQLRPEERGLSVWTSEQMRSFLHSVAGERLAPLWRLYAVTGCRRGEALAARWDDLDLDQGRWELSAR